MASTQRKRRRKRLSRSVSSHGRAQLHASSSQSDVAPASSSVPPAAGGSGSDPAASAPPPAAESAPPGHRIRARHAWLWAVGILCVLWTLLVVTLSPTVLRGLVERTLSEVLNAPITIGGLSVNPFTFSITVREIRVPYLDDTSNPDGALLTIERLDIHPHLHLPGRTVPVQASFRVQKPVLDITYLGNGDFSFSKHLPASSAADEGGVPLFGVSDLELTEGTILLRDGPVGMVHTVSDVRFHVPLLPSADDIAPTLSAQVNGTAIDVKGRIEPADAGTLRTTFAIHVDPLHMEHFKRYLAEFTPLTLNSGTVETDLLFTLSQPALGRVSTSLSGTVRVADVEIANPGGEVVGRLHSGQARLVNFTLAERRIRLDSMELNGLYLRVSRDAKGHIDWEDWAHGAGATPEHVSPETPFVVEGADLILRDSDFTWVETDPAAARRIDITGVDGRIAEYSTWTGARTAMRLSFGISREGVLSVDGEGTLNPPSLHAALWVDDLPLGLLRPVLAGTPLNDILGRIAIKGNVVFGNSGKAHQKDSQAFLFAISDANASLSSVSFGHDAVPAPLQRKAPGNAAVRFRSLALAGFQFDTEARAVSAKTLTLTEPEVHVADTGLALPGTPHSQASTTPATAAGASAGKRLPDSLLRRALPVAAQEVLENWKIGIGSARIHSGRVQRLADGRMEPLAAGLELETGAVTSPATPIPVSLRTQGEPAQAVSFQGTLRPAPLRLEGRLGITDLALERTASLLQSVTGLVFSGKLSAGLDTLVEERSSGASPEIRISGTLAAQDAALSDGRTGTRYGILRRFSVEGLQYASQERFFGAGDILLDSPDLTISLTPEGLDFAASARPPRQEQPSPPFRISVDAIRCEGGMLTFRDLVHNAVSPIRDIEATVRNLTSAGETAELNLSGQLGGAPMSLNGAFNPLTSPPAANLTLIAKGVDLAVYSAYVLTYLGYPVEQGRLDLKSVFTTSGWTFTLDNHIHLEKPVLGPKDTRPGAPDYPVSLGLTLLEDLRGNVTLDLPVSGRLDDASVQVGGLVGRALGGLFAKVVTSPFALLGGLVGLLTPDDPAVQVIGFSFGEVVPDPDAEKRLRLLATALASRPKVGISLIGMYEPDGDARGLKHQRVLHRVRLLKRDSLPRAVRPADVDAISFGPGEYEKLLRQLFLASPAGRKARGDEPAGLMEQRLEAFENVSGKELEALGRERAERVRAALLRFGPSLGERVTVASHNGVATVRSGMAQVELQLR